MDFLKQESEKDSEGETVKTDLTIRFTRIDDRFEDLKQMFSDEIIRLKKEQGLWQKE